MDRSLNLYLELSLQNLQNKLQGCWVNSDGVYRNSQIFKKQQSASRAKDELITFNHAIDIGTKVAVEITRDFLVARGIEVASTTANPWSQSPLPPIYMGELDDIELNIGRQGTQGLH